MIKFIYDGTLRINISKVNAYKQHNFFSEHNHKNIMALQNQVSAKHRFTLYSDTGNFNQQAELISHTLKHNSTILRGELWKLTPLYRFLKAVGF